jgi:hypothetical protein
MPSGGKGIVGIYSLSTARPIKIGNFETQSLDFTDKTSYADWVFMAVMPIPAVSPAFSTPSARQLN